MKSFRLKDVIVPLQKSDAYVQVSSFALVLLLGRLIFFILNNVSDDCYASNPPRLY